MLYSQATLASSQQEPITKEGSYWAVPFPFPSLNGCPITPKIGSPLQVTPKRVVTQCFLPLMNPFVQSKGSTHTHRFSVRYSLVNRKSVGRVQEQLSKESRGEVSKCWRDLNSYEVKSSSPITFRVGNRVLRVVTISCCTRQSTSVTGLSVPFMAIPKLTEGSAIRDAAWHANSVSC